MERVVKEIQERTYWACDRCGKKYTKDWGVCAFCFSSTHKETGKIEVYVEREVEKVSRFDLIDLGA